MFIQRFKFPYVYLVHGRSLIIGHSTKLSIENQIRRQVDLLQKETRTNHLVFYRHDRAKTLSHDIKHAINHSWIDQFDFANSYCRQRGAIFAYSCFIKNGKVYEFVE